MIVAELIEELKKHEPTARVCTYNREWGHVLADRVEIVEPETRCYGPEPGDHLAGLAIVVL